jgi:hypothetical protein
MVIDVLSKGLIIEKRRLLIPKLTNVFQIHKIIRHFLRDTMTPKEPETSNCIHELRSDAVQRFFRRPFFLSLTIGIPFCIFKLLFGLTAVCVGSVVSFPVTVFGWMVTGWASADLCLNLGRVAFDLLGHPAPFEYCTIAQIGQIFHRPMVFLAIDTLLTFAIICTMLWSGWIAFLPELEMKMWYAATTLNLISLSLVVLYNEIRNS